MFMKCVEIIHYMIHYQRRTLHYDIIGDTINDDTCNFIILIMTKVDKSSVRSYIFLFIQLMH